MQQPQAILGPEAHRLVEQRYSDASPPLMERAGAAAAQLALELLAGERVALVVAGPGNNGGDALVAARLLKQAGAEAHVVFLGAAERLPPDAARAYQAWLACGGKVSAGLAEQRYALVIDGLFGIGLKRAIDGQEALWVERMNASACPVLALDLPSGLDAWTGAVWGVAVRASHTATFMALKPGLLTLDGPDHCGALSVHDLGVDPGAVSGAGLSLTPALFPQALRRRRQNTHKGSYGSVGIIGGAAGMAGAALLAGRAALQLGAGRVYVGMLERLAVDPGQPELMLRSVEETLERSTCLAVGPGLGQAAAALAALRRALASELPLLLDADALNLLAAHPVLGNSLRKRAAPALLTPHPAEAARLLACSTEAVQADRVEAGRELARRYGAGVVLKGCGSIVAFPDGRWFINRSGNPGLASAGSGDVLAGIAAAMLAQGVAADQALLAAVYLHGAAADACVAAGAGPVGLSAGEIIPAARRLLNAGLDA